MNNALVQTFSALALGLFSALLIALWEGFPTVAVINLGLLFLVVTFIACLFLRRSRRNRRNHRS